MKTKQKNNTELINEESDLSYSSLVNVIQNNKNTGFVIINEITSWIGKKEKEAAELGHKLQTVYSDISRYKDAIHRTMSHIKSDYPLKLVINNELVEIDWSEDSSMVDTNELIIKKSKVINIQGDEKKEKN